MPNEKKIRDPKSKWPKFLAIPDEEQFEHGDWVDPDPHFLDGTFSSIKGSLLEIADRAKDEYASISKGEAEKLAYQCDTQCCLVGWAALAFGERGCTPDHIKNPATAEFLNKFVELAGFQTLDELRSGGERYRYGISRLSAIAWRASDVFERRSHPKDEHLDDEYLREASISPQRAREVWIETAEFFGYDTDNLID